MHITSLQVRKVQAQMYPLFAAISNKQPITQWELAYFGYYYEIDANLQLHAIVMSKVSEYISKLDEQNVISTDVYYTLPKYASLAYLNYKVSNSLSPPLNHSAQFLRKVILLTPYILITYQSLAQLADILLANYNYEGFKIYKSTATTLLFKSLLFYSHHPTVKPLIPYQYLAILSLCSYSHEYRAFVTKQVFDFLRTYSGHMPLLPLNIVEIMANNVIQISLYGSKGLLSKPIDLLLPYAPIFSIANGNNSSIANQLSGLFKQMNAYEVRANLLTSQCAIDLILGLVKECLNDKTLSDLCDILCYLIKRVKSFNDKTTYSALLIRIAFQTKLQQALQNYLLNFSIFSQSNIIYIYFLLMNKILLLSDDEDVLQQDSIYVQYSFPQREPLAKLIKYIVELAIQAVNKKIQLPANWEKLIIKVCTLLYYKERRCQLFDDDFWVQEQLIPILCREHLPEHIKILLNHLPFIVPFERRIQLFYATIKQDQEKMQSEVNQNLVIRRNSLFKDGIQYILSLGEKFKGNVKITFIDEHGHQEEGIGYGLFKEYLTQVSKIAFDPHVGYFTGTEERTLMPNADYGMVEDPMQVYQFIGMLMGKALYENILINPVFSRCFLNLILGHENSINDLRFIDKQLYKSAIYLKYNVTY